MTVLDKNQSSDLKTARLDLNNGWTAIVALYDSENNPISRIDWKKCLKNPPELPENPQKTIRANDSSSVIIKNLNIEGKNLSVVVKSQVSRPGFQNFFRSLRPAKAIRNFNTAVKLCQNNIPTAQPIAALQHKKGPFVTCSIYITEYTNDSRELYSFLRNNLVPQKPDNYKLKKELSMQIARIFASLHKASLWHRDAKAGNFIVRNNSQNEIKILLIDMDGIKPYRIRRNAVRFVCFVRLATSILWLRAINTTDYLRTFIIYCNLSNLEESKRREIFVDLIRRAVAQRLLKMAYSAINDSESEK